MEDGQHGAVVGGGEEVRVVVDFDFQPGPSHPAERPLLGDLVGRHDVLREPLVQADPGEVQPFSQLHSQRVLSGQLLVDAARQVRFRRSERQHLLRDLVEEARVPALLHAGVQPLDLRGVLVSLARGARACYAVHGAVRREVVVHVEGHHLHADGKVVLENSAGALILAVVRAPRVRDDARAGGVGALDRVQQGKVAGRRGSRAAAVRGLDPLPLQERGDEPLGSAVACERAVRER
mmetsp:Transcript_75454/g.163252  ORF Transcript_75454/g.163252 Transcript_75454/m.163252 type:complete len:236 (-) Transcript_75454:416-1123(-)